MLSNHQKNPLKNKILTIISTSLAYGFGLGLYLHDFAHSVWQLGELMNGTGGGMAELIGFHGAYIGAIIATIGFIIVMHEYIVEAKV